MLCFAKVECCFAEAEVCIVEATICIAEATVCFPEANFRSAKQGVSFSPGNFFGMSGNVIIASLAQGICFAVLTGDLLQSQSFPIRPILFMLAFTAYRHRHIYLLSVSERLIHVVPEFFLHQLFFFLFDRSELPLPPLLQRQRRLRYSAFDIRPSIQKQTHPLTLRLGH